MKIADYHALESRVTAGEVLADEFGRLRLRARDTIQDGDDVFPWTESFVLAFRHMGVYPPLEAAKALVDVALAADETMPIVCPYDSEIKGALSPVQRSELFDYIAERIGDNRSPQSFSAAADLADFVTDIDLGLND